MRNSFRLWGLGEPVLRSRHERQESWFRKWVNRHGNQGGSLSWSVREGERTGYL